MRATFYSISARPGKRLLAAGFCRSGAFSIFSVVKDHVHADVGMLTFKLV